MNSNQNKVKANLDAEKSKWATINKFSHVLMKYKCNKAIIHATVNNQNLMVIFQTSNKTPI